MAKRTAITFFLERSAKYSYFEKEEKILKIWSKLLIHSVYSQYYYLCESVSIYPDSVDPEIGGGGGEHAHGHILSREQRRQLCSIKLYVKEDFLERKKYEKYGQTSWAYSIHN